MIVKVDGRVEEFFIYKKDCPVDYAADFIDPYYDACFHRDDDDVWCCDQYTYEWWDNMCQMEQAIVNAIDSAQFASLPQSDKDEFYDIEYECGELEFFEQTRYNWLDEKGLIDHE